MRKTIVFISVVLFFLSIGNKLFAQEQEFLRAMVLDQQTKEPIIFATVRILGKAKGVITNMDGGFRLPLVYMKTTDSVEISSMGYNKKVIELARLSENDINILYLSPSVLSLPEAVVSARKKKEPSAKRIVRRAIENIPNNYPITDFAAIGYYRDYQLRDDNYVNLNEAIIEVIDEGFDTYDYPTSKVRIYDYNPNLNFEQDSESRLAYDYKNYKKVIENAYLSSYGGNEFTILRIHDALRNYNINAYDFVNVLERDFLSNHHFKKENSITQDNEEIFIISLRQTSQLNRIVGKIYISKTDYAIHKMEYTLYDSERRLTKGEFDKNGSNFETVFEVITEYKRKHNRMFPNYISFFNTFKSQKAPTFIVEEVTLDKSKGGFVVKFNDSIDSKTGLKKSNYDFRFDNRKIVFDRIKIRGQIIELYPKNDEDFNQILKRISQLQDKDIPIKASIKDVKNFTLTAKVNEIQYETYKQYREFFIQEIKPNGSELTDSLFMKKDIPIFKNQPISRPDNFEDYWMNTPLPNVNN